MIEKAVLAFTLSLLLLLAVGVVGIIGRYGATTWHKGDFAVLLP